MTRLLNYVFPTQCIVCATRGPDICNHCLSLFQPPKPSNYDWITSCANYQDARVETTMRHIKNIPNNRVARILAKKLASIVPQNIHPVIIPIPIGPDRFFERGYNQAELLAKPLAKKLQFPVRTNVLIKTRKTNKQGTSHSKQEREKNIQKSFGIKNPHLIKDKDILIVDDITTTGSTLSEARETLLKAGARNVYAVTVAN